MWLQTVKFIAKTRGATHTHTLQSIICFGSRSTQNVVDRLSSLKWLGLPLLDQIVEAGKKKSHGQSATSAPSSAPVEKNCSGFWMDEYWLGTCSLVLDRWKLVGKICSLVLHGWTTLVGKICYLVLHGWTTLVGKKIGWALVGLCDVAEVMIIHKMIWPYLVTY